MITLSPTDWNELLTEVASGKKQWLELVPTLARFTDAKRSASLEDALAYSLTKNTVDTLKIMGILDANNYPFMIGSDVICVPPFDKSHAEIAHFYNKTREALLDTHEGASCLWILESSMEEWTRFDNSKS